MKKSTPTFRKYLPFLAICILILSALACNFSQLGQPAPEQNFQPGEEHSAPEEEFRPEDEPQHPGEGEPRPEEEQPAEPFHEEEPPHGEEPPHNEECPPESECPGNHGSESGNEVQADLDVTDIFPDNLPHGRLVARITNNGPTVLMAWEIEMRCEAHGVSWGGPQHGTEDLVEEQRIIIQAGPGETWEADTGITIDANLYQYEATCEIYSDIDPNPGNNFYMELVPPK
ncbi:MAG: hypothetical protein ISR60_02240 [Anaerolineales bacterium]|nr:hypothetical protein [Anaerolineales bacterium]